MRPLEVPVTVMQDDGQKRKSHPSFGSIVLHRVTSNGTYLAGSAVQHHGYVCLSISEAEFIEHGYGHESLFSGKQIVEVCMTEHQFAELISRWNVGDGTPCTITDRPEPGSKMMSVAPPPPGQGAREAFGDLIDGAVNDINKLIMETAKEIDDIVGDRLPKKQRERLDQALSILKRNVPSNLNYATESLHEVAERIIARGKVEMEAAGRSLIERLGLSSLADKAQKLLPMPSFDREEKS